MGRSEDPKGTVPSWILSPDPNGLTQRIFKKDFGLHPLPQAAEAHFNNVEDGGLTWVFLMPQREMVQMWGETENLDVECWPLLQLKILVPGWGSEIEDGIRGNPCFFDHLVTILKAAVAAKLISLHSPLFLSRKASILLCATFPLHQKGVFLPAASFLYHSHRSVSKAGSSFHFPRYLSCVRSVSFLPQPPDPRPQLKAGSPAVNAVAVSDAETTAASKIMSIVSGFTPTQRSGSVENRLRTQASQARMLLGLKACLGLAPSALEGPGPPIWC